MSTTLANGIIIPDNGSRNWGGDLANNWNIIDLNVGYMNDVKNKVTTLENNVAENTADIQTNASNISALQTSKQDTINDLETIRSGANSGATAVQPSALSDYYTKSEVDANLSSKANDSDVVHKSGDTMTGDLLGVGSNNLGTSTDKWKTLNGVNPGALSLPGSNVMNVSSYITVLDGSAANKFTPPINGWLHINGLGVLNNGYIFAIQGRVGMMSSLNAVMSRCAVVIPVAAGVEVSIFCKLTSLTWANLTVSQGNV